MSDANELGRQILTEHGAVRDAIRDISAELKRLRAEPEHQHDAGGLGRMLGDLDVHLGRHFELEERHGLLGEDAQVSTTTQRRADELLLQHAELAREVAALRDAAERAAAGALSDDFADGLQAFLHHLGEHERAENELVQGLVVDDVGTGD